jgi:inorganic pyrophosphatase/exopolyphosphatase
VGTLSRFHLLRPRRKQVILMDHNEKAQSVPGLEQADILEIVDHHRLADIQTTNPISVRNEPVGSTATIVASMYQEKGLMPTAKMAGLIAAAIVSDTVMFKSPTCTQKDIDMAKRMARIANEDLDELGRAIFSATCGDEKSVSDILNTDYKEFHIAGHDLAVSQITCMDSDRVLQRKEEFLSLMEEIRAKRGFDTVVLMITDVLLEGTQLLFVGDVDTIGEAFHITSDEVLDWDRIYTYLAHAAGVDANLIHITSDYLGEWNPDLRESLLGDHSCSAVFDNSKIKKFVPDFHCQVPFEEGAKRVVAWFDADPAARAIVDYEWDNDMDDLVATYRAGLPKR